MVFDPFTAPQQRPDFMQWYWVQTKWSEGHSYDDPAVSTPSRCTPGGRRGIWSVTVSGNWRITFRFSGKDAIDVDYEDYH